MRSAAYLVARAALAAEDMAVSVEQRSEGDPGLPSISIALEAPCTGLGGGPADEERRGQRSIDASDETISKSAASTKSLIDRLLGLPRRSS